MSPLLPHPSISNAMILAIGLGLFPLMGHAVVPIDNSTLNDAASRPVQDAKGYVVTKLAISGPQLEMEVCPHGFSPTLDHKATLTTPKPWILCKLANRVVPTQNPQQFLDGLFGASKAMFRGIAPFNRHEAVIYYDPILSKSEQSAKQP